MPQSEQQLENTLIKQMNRLGFMSVVIPDSSALNENLKTPLNKYLKGNFKEIKIAVKKIDEKFERLTKEARFIHMIKPIVNTHYKTCES